MTDRELEARLRAWYRAGVGADEAAPPSLRRDVAAIPRAIPRPARWFGRGRGFTLLAAAALLLVGGALAAGTGLLRLPSVVPPEPVPPIAVVATPSPAVESTSPINSPSPAPSATPAAVQPRAASWTPTGNMLGAQPGGTTTLLPNGKVLVTSGYETGPGFHYFHYGSATLYDPATGTWTATQSMIDGLQGQAAGLLLDGKVLVAGGNDGEQTIRRAELYDPASGTWAATGSMGTPREGDSATVLPDGRVLVAGGQKSNSGRPMATAELYDPATGTWTATGSMGTRREGHSATLLPDGRVLVVGGVGGGGWDVLATAELYDPASGTWAATGSMGTRRESHTATLLPDGRVLVAGGTSGSDRGIATAELYDPASGTWAATGSMGTPREVHTATLLPDGKVLAAGGRKGLLANGNADVLASAELFDPATGSWTPTLGMGGPREFHTATLLPDGTVLVVGGEGDAGTLATAELYDPGSGQ